MGTKWHKFICPIDQLPLAFHSGSLRCEKNHTYDIAREGYCNLLLVQNKASADPGDSPEMVMARRRFLEWDFYEPLAQKVCAIAKELKTTRLLDAGCGEGYYLRKIHLNIPALECIGIDISKPAIKAAAKLSPDISYAVASNKRLPVEKGSVDLILVLFGFPLWESFAEVQNEGSHVLLVDPAEDHLLELREIIYPSVTKSVVRPIEGALPSGYELVREEKLKFTIDLKLNSQIQDLLVMTPHAHRITAEGTARLAEVKQLKLTVDLSVRLLQK